MTTLRTQRLYHGPFSIVSELSDGHDITAKLDAAGMFNVLPVDASGIVRY